MITPGNHNRDKFCTVLSRNEFSTDDVPFCPEWAVTLYLVMKKLLFCVTAGMVTVSYLWFMKNSVWINRECFAPLFYSFFYHVECVRISGDVDYFTSSMRRILCVLHRYNSAGGMMFSRLSTLASIGESLLARYLINRLQNFARCAALVHMGTMNWFDLKVKRLRSWLDQKWTKFQFWGNFVGIEH